jgi:hypothetical protein
MSIFNYTLPSGSTFRLSAPAGTTQLQADLIFYGQVAAGALVGYSPGQTLTGAATNITKFALSRLDRGTAGVDTRAILALMGSGLGAPNTLNGPDALTNNSLNALTNSILNSLTNDGLGALTNNSPSALINSILNSLTNNGLSTLTNNSLNALTNNIIGELTTNILDTLTNNGLNAILTLTNLPTSTGIPVLVNTPLTSPINQANLVNINPGLPVAAIGPLSSIQVQGILAQIANLVDQPADTMSNDKGVGQYGLSCVQLEQAGYVKPNTWKRFIFDPAPLTNVLSSPGVWTGKGGVTTAAQFLANPGTQTRAMTSLLQDGYSGLVSNGVITPSTTQAVTARVGQVFAQNSVTSALTNTATGDVGALVANAGRFGSAATAAWSQSSNLTNLAGQLPNPAGVLSRLSGSLSTTVGNIGQSVGSLTSNLDITGKAGQFATAFGNPTSALTNLANTNVGAMATGALNNATAAATSAITNATAAVSGAVSNAVDSVNNQITNVTDKLGSLSNLSLDSLSNIFGGGAGDLVAKVQTAAGFTNTTNRATLDVAFVKILGSSKIPVPSFEAPSANSLSLSSIADISSAATILQNLKSQGGALLSQVSQAQNTVTGLISQAQTIASSTATQAGGVISNALNQAGRRIG